MGQRLGKEALIKMGDWVIIIEGTGMHDNADYSQDADKMMARFVEELKVASQEIESATFTSGQRKIL